MAEAAAGTAAMDEMTLTFRCAPELASILPPPIPAVQGLPDWFKAMPQKAFNAILQEDSQTVKRCPPFIDAMTYGFLLPLVCDLKVENGEFSWDFDLPPGPSGAARSPISFHDGSQVAGSPFFEQDRFIVKFHNFWTVEAPPGYSLLFTHPANRADLPFTAITGLVDSDLYRENLVHFPARWHDVDFNGVLPKGTPVVQCMPVKRESWRGNLDRLSDESVRRMENLSAAIGREQGVYRRNFRAGKR
ncbi:MAG TPA: hypothetical protein VFB31_00510 [Pseudolabrys sp.]|nr:hypothetical protein [Pseudolabrys sp.]